jgi:hypothetical protein
VLGVIPLSFSTILLGTGDAHLCDSDSSWDDPSGTCRYQGMSYLFCGLWTVSWWFLQSYSVFDIIVVNSLRTRRVKTNEVGHTFTCTDTCCTDTYTHVLTRTPHRHICMYTNTYIHT